MLDTTWFQSIFDETQQTVIAPQKFLVCIGVSLCIGLMLALLYQRKSKSTPGFITTLVTLPAIVSVVIMLVNGSVGTGVAVAGAFSLVRFRSAAGTAKEICAIFIAMAAGLASGLGYLAFAVLFTIILCIAELLLSTAFVQAFCSETGESERILRITIPEELDYTDVFTDLFEGYFENYSLTEVKSTNLGSLFRLSYTVNFKKAVSEKQLLDALRCRNGNLEISLSRPLSNRNEL